MHNRFQYEMIKFKRITTQWCTGAVQFLIYNGHTYVVSCVKQLNRFIIVLSEISFHSYISPFKKLFVKLVLDRQSMLSRNYQLGCYPNILSRSYLCLYDSVRGRNRERALIRALQYRSIHSQGQLKLLAFHQFYPRNSSICRYERKGDV